MEQDLKETIIRSYSERAVEHKQSCGCCEKEESASGAAETANSAYEPDLGCGAPLEHAGLARGMTVLDLGSGSGREVFEAAREVGPDGRAIGLDMTPAMISLARKNASILGVQNTEFHLGEIEQIPLPDGSVDRVISNCVINLTRDKKKAFSEVYRVLAPGGRFAIADMTTSKGLPDEVRNDPDRWCACVGGALRTEEYLSAIRENGFRDVKIVSEVADHGCGREGLGLRSITVTGIK